MGLSDRAYYDSLCEEMARRGRKKPRKRKMTVTRLPDDPKIAKAKKKRKPGSAPVAKPAARTPMRGDRIGHSEDAIWLNAARAAEIQIKPDAKREAGL